VSRPPLTRRPPPSLPLHPDGEVLRAALQRLTASPDWPVLVAHLKAKEVEAWYLAEDASTGALLERHHRKTFIRELERLDKRVTDDDRNDHCE
jgi:hypothetical protein